jgi:hypothetical protein
MAKDKSKTFTYAASVTINGKAYKTFFRKEKQCAEFIDRVAFLEGVSNACPDIGVYVYENVDSAINTMANFANRAVKI